MKRQVRCVLRQYDDTKLKFELIFDDGCIKLIQLDAYQIRAMRSASLRDIINQATEDYYESIGDVSVTFELIFV